MGKINFKVLSVTYIPYNVLQFQNFNIALYLGVEGLMTVFSSYSKWIRIFLGKKNFELGLKKGVISKKKYLDLCIPIT